MGDRRGAYRFWSGGLREDHLEDKDVDWRTILKWMFKKWVGGA